MDACDVLCAAAPLDLAVLARQVELNSVNRLAAAADVAAWTPPSRPIQRTTPKRVLPRNRRLRRFSMSPTAATATRNASLSPFEDSPQPPRRRSLALPRAATFTAPAQRLHSVPPLEMTQFSSFLSLPPPQEEQPHYTFLRNPTVRVLDFSQSDSQSSFLSSTTPTEPKASTNPFDNLQLKPSLPRGATFTQGATLTRDASASNWPPRKMLPLRKRISYPPKPPTPSDKSGLDEWGDLVASPFATPSPKKQRRMVPLGSPCDVRAVQF